MPRSFPPLNDLQLKALQWIADGCSDGVMTGHSYKITAMALRNRRLVVISKSGGAWEGKVTPAGEHYLNTGEYEPTATSQSEPRRSVEPLKRPPKATSRSAKPPRQPAPRPLTPTDHFLTELKQKGQVEVASADLPRYERYMSAAHRYRKVPPGKQLARRWDRSSGMYLIGLEDAPAWTSRVPAPVPVPRTLRNPHPTVSALQASGNLPGIGKKVERRALLLLQALAAEAQQRGHITKPILRPKVMDVRRANTGHMVITVGTCAVTVTVKQENDRHPHVPTASEVREAARYAYMRVPQYDYVPGAALSVHLAGGMEHLRSSWSDGKRQQLEERLPEILHEAELRGEEAEHRRQAEIAAAAAKKKRWEDAMQRAHQQYVESCKAKDLLSMVARWEEVSRVRSFLDEAKLVAKTYNEPDFAAALAWIDWVEVWVDSADPLGRPLRLPDVPGPTPDDLRPFLGGLSPHGPQAVW